MRGLVTLLALSWAVVAVAGEEGFQVKSAPEYAARQEQAGVTVAVKAYRSQEEQKEAFGKAEPYKYGFLPVLVVITNNSDHPLGLQNLKVRFIDSRGEGLEPTSGEDLTFFNPKGHQPKDRPAYIPIPLGGPKVKKGPLAKPEITRTRIPGPGNHAENHCQRIFLLQHRHRAADQYACLYFGYPRHDRRQRSVLLRDPLAAEQLALASGGTSAGRRRGRPEACATSVARPPR